MAAVLFDVDGVLLNSCAGYRGVWSRWCELRGVDFEVAWAATHGRRPVETVAEVAAHLDPREEYLLLRDILAASMDAFPAFPGARPLLVSLPSDLWGVVTSGQRATVLARFVLEGLRAPGVFIDGDDVALGKPAPDGYLQAASRLGVPPDACLVVEDAPAGVLAGKAAGMRVIAIASTHSRSDLNPADHHANSLEEATPFIRAWLTGPPLAAASALL